MPTALRIGPYRFFFFSNEGDEPVHIHFQRERALAKFWLRPILLAGSSGFQPQELRRIQRHVEGNQDVLIEAWNDYFGS